MPAILGFSEFLENVLEFGFVLLIGDIHIECSKNSNETYTFMGLGRAGCFGQS